MFLTPARFWRRLSLSSRLLLGLVLAGPALLTAQPEGKGRPAQAEKSRADGPALGKESGRESKGKPSEGVRERVRERETAEERERGLDAVADRKTEQERKELGKGSEQGQLKRAENSRKWWRFWEKKKDPVPATPPAPPPPPAP